MATLSDSLVSSSSRKLAIRRRPDLSAQRQQYLGKTYIVVKEPVGLNYYRFQEEEYAILQMLDGSTSLDEIKERFEKEFPPQKITLEELQQFLGMLHRSGLAIADMPGQGHQLMKRGKKRKRQELFGAMTNVLAIRFKGFDPERLLNWLYPKVSWIFSPLMVMFCVMLMIGAALLVTVQFDVFAARLPGFHQFFSLGNAWLLALTLGLTKVLHEFGHGLTCKHFGGECHEMGVMILVLTPCLYCNVSDSWMLPNKWHRAAIGAAGMYIEVVLASICTFVWWVTDPNTVLANVCLNVMFISSVSTILFNANPLLRYDGYYILSDITEIPNLRQKASTLLNRKLGKWCLGLEEPEDPFLPQRNKAFFILYSMASVVYRWFVLASILWFMYQIFKPYRLEIISQGIIAMSIFSLVVMPLYKLGKFFYVPGRLEKVKKVRMYATLLLLGAVVYGVLMIPVPHNISCPFVVEPRDAETIYINVPGTLKSIDVKTGDTVQAGQQLAKLENIDLGLEILRLTGTRDQYKRQLEVLEKQQYTSEEARRDLPALQEAFESIEQQIEKRMINFKRLTITAPVDGVVIPPNPRPSDRGPEGTLPTWSGSPLDKSNIGALLGANHDTEFCRIGDPRQFDIKLLIDQGDMEFVRDPKAPSDQQDQQSDEERIGQMVSIKFDQMPHRTFTGWISIVAHDRESTASEEFSTRTGGEAAVVTDKETGQEKFQSVQYYALVPFPDPKAADDEEVEVDAIVDNPDILFRPGLRGRAKIHADWQPLGQRLWRFITHTFNFEL